MPLFTRRNAGVGRYELERLGAFCDAVIAIAITILVLGLEVPSVHEVPESSLSDFLLASTFSVLGYVLSFVLIGMYWMQHYTMFHFLTHADRPFVVLNLIFLLCLSFLPFPTGLHSVYRDDELSVVVYAAAQIACALALLAIWLYATAGNRLVAPEFPQHIRGSVARRIAITPILCLVAIAVSFIHPLLSRLIFVAIPLCYLSDRAVDKASVKTQSENQ